MKSRKRKYKSGVSALLVGLSVSLIVLIIIFWWTNLDKLTRKLPYLGDPTYQTINTPDGAKMDTIYPVIPPFSFTDQHGQPVSNQTYKGHIYVADFFFTTCPTICPVMSRNLKKVYDQYAGNSELMFLSHTIDPRHDTPEVLKRYAEKLGADKDRWHFVTGEKEKIYQLAENGYYAHVAKEDSKEGGFVHSGALTLVDSNGHMRGVYDGISDEDVSKLIADLKILLAEYKHTPIAAAVTKN